MKTWWSRLFDPKPGADQPSEAPDELSVLKARRRELLDYVSSLKAHGFDSLAVEDEAALRKLDQKILALQLKTGLTDEAFESPLP